MFEATVDRFGGSVARARSVEVGEHVPCALLEGAPEPADLDESCGNAGDDRVNDGLHHLLALLLVGFAVGGDDALVDAQVASTST